MNRKVMSILVITISILFFYNRSVYADEYDEYDEEYVEYVSELEQYEEYIDSEQLAEQTEVVTTDISMMFLPETETEIETSISDTNYISSAAIDTLVNDINDFAFENGYKIVIPETFGSDLSYYVEQLLYLEVNPEVFREYFIVFVLSEIGITSDDYFYDVLYDEVGEYYDYLTGISEDNSDDAATTIILCMLGTTSTLSFIKWVM